MPAPKVIDLDSELDFLDEDGPLTTKRVKLLGREWTVVCDLNFWNISTAGDVDGLSRLLLNVIAEDEQAEFAAALGKVRGLDAEKLFKIIEKIMEVAAERPTKQPSASSRGAASRTSARKSVAATSRTGAAPRKR